MYTDTNIWANSSRSSIPKTPSVHIMADRPMEKMESRRWTLLVLPLGNAALEMVVPRPEEDDDDQPVDSTGAGALGAASVLVQSGVPY